MKKALLTIPAFLGFLIAMAQGQWIPLYDGIPKGSEGWEQQQREMLYPGTDYVLVQNVVKPALRAYLPPKGKANGTAVIIEPGGGWETIVEGVEGYPVADSLNAHGITVFLLRYRLLKTIDNFLYTPDKKSGINQTTRIKDYNEKLRSLDLEDARTAMRYVRSHATEYGIRKDRIGFMGFSAGAFNTTVLGTEYDAGSRPDFIAPIYGAISDHFTVPADAPPLFIAHAADDALVKVEESLHFFQEWQKVTKRAEMHVFAKGGHGFGGLKKNLPVDHWTNLFCNWLKSEGLLD